MTSFCPKMGVSWICPPPQLRGQISKKNNFGGVNRRFPAKLVNSKNMHYYQNYCVNSNQSLHSDKDHQIPFAGGPYTHHKSKMAAAAAILNKSSAVAENGDRLATIGMCRKWGGAAVGGGWVPIGSPSNTMWSGPHCVRWRPLILPLYQLGPSNRLATTVGVPRSSV